VPAAKGAGQKNVLAEGDPPPGAKALPTHLDAAEILEPTIISHFRSSSLVLAIPADGS
jgi:hypothetical protein